MKFSNKTVLLFDLDGTLIDSAPDLACAGNLMLAELNRPTYSEQCFRDWIGNGAKVMVQRALSGSSKISSALDTEALESALSLFLKLYKANVCVKTQLYPGVDATVRTLKEQGYKLVIVTNKPNEFIAPIIAGLGLDGLFDLILGGDSLPKRKPDPLPLLHVCQQLPVDVSQCLMIGDSKNDILAAKAAKMDSIGLTYGYNYGEDIGLHHPELVVTHFADIVGALRSDSQDE